MTTQEAPWKHQPVTLGSHVWLQSSPISSIYILKCYLTLPWARRPQTVHSSSPQWLRCLLGSGSTDGTVFSHVLPQWPESERCSLPHKTHCEHGPPLPHPSQNVVLVYSSLSPPPKGILPLLSVLQSLWSVPPGCHKVDCSCFNFMPENYLQS